MGEEAVQLGIPTIQDLSSEAKEAVRLGKFIVTQTTLAFLFGVDRSTIATWTRAGCPVADTDPHRPKEYNLAEVLPWIRARDRAAADEASSARSSPELDEARLRKLRAEAALIELDLSKRKAELIPASDIEPRWARMVLSMRERILSIAPVAVQRGVVPPEHEDAIAALCHEALAELSCGGEGSPA